MWTRVGRLPDERWRTVEFVWRGAYGHVTRHAVFGAFAGALRPGGGLIVDVREWELTAQRKSREPVFRKSVTTDRGGLCGARGCGVTDCQLPERLRALRGFVMPDDACSGAVLKTRAGQATLIVSWGTCRLWRLSHRTRRPCEGARTAAVYCSWRIGASPTSAERTASTPTGLVVVRMISFPARESGQRARMACPRHGRERSSS